MITNVPHVFMGHCAYFALDMPHAKRNKVLLNNLLNTQTEVRRTCCRRHQEHADVEGCRVRLEDATKSCHAATERQDANSCQPAGHRIHQLE